MSTLNYLIEKINSDESLNKMQKLSMIANVNRSFEETAVQQNLKEAIKKASYNSDTIQILEVIKLDDNYAIFLSKYPKDSEHYYRTYDIKNNLMMNEVSKTLHDQILITLGNHYDGPNQRFSTYASRMLNLESSKN